MALAEIPARRLLLFGSKKGSSGGLDPNWWKRFQYGGVLPNVVLDFENGVYWDGSNTLTDPSSMIGGSPTITAGSGLLCNALNITGKGALLAALQGGAYNIQAAMDGGANGSNLGIFSDQAPNLLIGEVAGGGAFTFRNSDSSALSISTTTDWTKHVWASLSVTSSLRVISCIGAGGNAAGLELNDANGYAANPSTFTIGSWNGGSLFGGYIAQLAVTSAVLPTKVIPPAAFTGTNGWWWNGDATNSMISYGNVLQYEYTQPWTVIVAALCANAAGGGVSGVSGVMFTNVPNPANSAFPGYEFWVDGNGHLHVRIINNIGSNFVGIYGSTNVADGAWHVFAASYDGSGRAAGVKIYLDGVPETLTVESDTLNGQSIKSTDGAHPNNYLIGNQTGESFGWPGAIGFFRQFNAAKSQSYIQQYKINLLLPAIDSSCVLAPKLSEGGSNTTTADLSASGLTGTLSSASCWLRG